MDGARWCSAFRKPRRGRPRRERGRGAPGLRGGCGGDVVGRRPWRLRFRDAERVHVLFDHGAAHPCPGRISPARCRSCRIAAATTMLPTSAPTPAAGSSSGSAGTAFNPIQSVMSSSALHRQPLIGVRGAVLVLPAQERTLQTVRPKAQRLCAAAWQRGDRGRRKRQAGFLPRSRPEWRRRLHPEERQTDSIPARPRHPLRPALRQLRRAAATRHVRTR